MNNKFIQLTTFECTNINGGGALGVIAGSTYGHFKK